MLNSSIWPIDSTQSGASLPSKSEHGSDSNEGVLRIPQSSKSKALSSDCLMSYTVHSLGGLYLYRDAVSVFYSPSHWHYVTCVGWYAIKHQ